MSSEPKLSAIIIGGFSGDNIGDLAILRAMLDGIGDLFKKVTVVVPTFARYEAAHEMDKWGVNVLSARNQLFQVLGLSCRALVILGGGNLISGRGYFWPHGIPGIMITLNRLCGYSPVILGLGVENNLPWLSRKMIYWLHSQATAVICRDNFSATAAKSYGLPASLIQVLPDCAYLLRSRLVPNKSSVANNIAVVAGRDNRRMKNAQIALTNLLKHLTHNYPHRQITLVAHDVRADYDAGLVKSIADKFTKVSILLPNDYAELEQFYMRTDVVLSNRIHPLIIGSQFGALPIACFISSDKVRSQAELLGASIVSDDHGLLNTKLLDDLLGNSFVNARLLITKRVALLKKDALNLRAIVKCAIKYNSRISPDDITNTF